MVSRVQIVGDWFHGRVPDGAVYAGRPAPGLPGSPWANPFKPGKPTPATVRLGGRSWPVPPERVGQRPADRAAARDWYRDLVHQAGLAGRIRADLAGSDVGCWCKPVDPCHVDVLARIANGERWWP